MFLYNSYAQITGIEIDYGNLTKLGHKYTEEDLFLMALRNGLEDRTYADWTRTKTVFYHGAPDYSTKDKVIENCTHDYVGVGSVLRMIPGIDIVSGGEQTLIGGMKITNETIQILLSIVRLTSLRILNILFMWHLNTMEFVHSLRISVILL